MPGKKGIGSLEAMIFLGTSGAIGTVRKSSVTKLISEGNEHYRKGRLGDAVRAYNQALKLDPENPVAWNNKGLILAVAGNFTEALKCHLKAVELDPKHVDAISNIGMAYTKLEKLEDAVKWYDKALKLDPRHETTWNNKGNLLSKLERYEEAMECYDRALEINPNYMAAMNNKAVELIHLKKYNEALGMLNKVLKARPLFSEGWYVKGKAYIGMGEFDKAIVCLERANRLNPDFQQAKRALEVLKRKLVEPPGQKAEAKKRPPTQREQEATEKSIQKEILKPRVELERMGDEFERPEEHLTKEEQTTLEFITDDDKSKTLLKKELGNKLSMPALERALDGLERKGLVTTSEDGRGKYYAKTEALGTISEEMVEEAEEQEPEADAGSMDFHGLVTRGRKYLANDRPGEAASILRKALKINPYDDMAICLLSQAQYDMGDRDRAINTISKILSSKPNFLPAWFTLANSAMKHKDFGDAAECFQKILEIQPGNEEASKSLEVCRKSLK